MAIRRRQRTLGRMMVAIGVAALFLAAFRMEATPAVGIAIAAACTGCLARRWYTETMALREARGLTTGRSDRTGLVVMSAIVAMAVVGLSNIAFLFGYWQFVNELPIELRKLVKYLPILRQLPPGGQPEDILGGAFWGIILALGVASILRWLLWPARVAPTSVDER